MFWFTTDIFLRSHASRLSSILIVILLSMSGCSFGSAPSSSVSTHANPTSTPLAVAASSTLTSHGNATSEIDADGIHRAYIHRLWGANGWLWRMSLPYNRLVIYYGNPFSPQMGPIGAYSDAELVARLKAQAKAYGNLDPSHPVVPGLDYVTPVAQPVPMQDGSWVYRMPDSSIAHYVDLASANHLLFFFDMQIGHSPIQKEVHILWPYIEQPGVNLSLDPEFDMAPGDIPGIEFGRMYAAEINWVIDQLSTLVLTQHLPPKVLIIHQFRSSMLPDWQQIKLKPGVSLITCVDGFGSPWAKVGDYELFDKIQRIEYTGMKLFYGLDKPLMSPSDVLALDPSPIMVMYQ